MGRDTDAPWRAKFAGQRTASDSICGQVLTILERLPFLHLHRSAIMIVLAIINHSGVASQEYEKMKTRYRFAFAALVCVAASASAAETITYKYDARGRLIKVVRTGTVNNNVQTTYTHDKANNRKTVVVTGSTSPPP
jgi:hypothetical protein